MTNVRMPNASLANDQGGNLRAPRGPPPGGLKFFPVPQVLHFHEMRLKKLEENVPTVSESTEIELLKKKLEHVENLFHRLNTQVAQLKASSVENIELSIEDEEEESDP